MAQGRDWVSFSLSGDYNMQLSFIMVYVESYTSCYFMYNVRSFMSALQLKPFLIRYAVLVKLLIYICYKFHITLSLLL